jgi:hypothetical protein
LLIGNRNSSRIAACALVPLQLFDESANAERVARLHGPSFKSGMEENLMWNAFYRKVGGPSRAICWMPSFKLTVCNRTAKARCCKQTLGAALFEERKWRCV